MTNNISFKVVLESNFPTHPSHPYQEELPTIRDLKDLINNYRITKNKYKKSKIFIEFDKSCKECGNQIRISEIASIKKCKEIYKNYEN